MKSVKYILFLLGAGIATISCQKDPVVTTANPTEGYYVSFDRPTLSMGEGDTVTVNILFNTDSIARKGATAGFTVVPPVTTNPNSASYTVIAMNNSPLSNLTVSGSTANANGYASFKFVAIDNNDVDGNRTFKIAINTTSLDVPVGNPFGAKMDTISISVIDDEVVITRAELLGTWSVQEEGDYLPTMPYTVSVTAHSTNPNYVVINGFSLDDMDVGVTIVGVLSLDKKVKTMTIPYQVAPGWEGPYGVESRIGAVSGSTVIAVPAATISKDTNGGFTITFEQKDSQNNSYEIFYVYNSGLYIGQERRNTVMTKLP